jgi:pyrroline-5-carboxylate reductase
VFQVLGTAPVIDEKLMDAATVLAASGTAFAFAISAPPCKQGLRLI